MDHISSRRCPESLAVLNRFMEEEGRDGALRIVGMLNRQVNLLWRTLTEISAGARPDQVGRKLGLLDFQVKPLMQQCKHWKPEELERAYHLLHQADGRLKSSSPARLVLETLVLALCR
jgi:DNA polymerase III delta subunit